MTVMSVQLFAAESLGTMSWGSREVVNRGFAEGQPGAGTSPAKSRHPQSPGRARRACPGEFGGSAAGLIV